MLKLVGRGNFYRIPIPVILLILIFVGFYFLLNKTTFGRAVYATGNAPNLQVLISIRQRLSYMRSLDLCLHWLV